MGGSVTWNSVGFDSIASETRRDAYDPPGFDPVIAKEGPVIMPLSLKKKDSGMLQRKQQVWRMVIQTNENAGCSKCIHFIMQALYARATGSIKNIGFMCFMVG